MNIPFSEDIAVIFLCELALTNDLKPVSLTEVAGKHQLSVLFLKKIARQLKTAGFIVSKEGVGGGYTLAVNPSSVTLWDVYAALGHKRGLDEDAFSALYTDCPINSACIPQIVRKTVRDSIRMSLNKITLSGLLKEIQI